MAGHSSRTEAQLFHNTSRACLKKLTLQANKIPVNICWQVLFDAQLDKDCIMCAASSAVPVSITQQISSRGMLIGTAQRADMPRF